ncbi:MAG: helix-turn-helix domain-containing protein [Gammaproteobacteria bacterium]|nr:helix-turn-helix domain-containing protein [Gammaproteobacteria bacterium]
MGSQLSKNEIAVLKVCHKTSRDSREKDRIKAVLAYDDGYSYSEIARLLLIDDETVRRHIEDYISKKKTKTENGGSDRLLNEVEQIELSRHLEEVTYLDVKSICAYVKSIHQIAYSPSGMRQLLRFILFEIKLTLLSRAI